MDQDLLRATELYEHCIVLVTVARRRGNGCAVCGERLHWMMSRRVRIRHVQAHGSERGVYVNSPVAVYQMCDHTTVGRLPFRARSFQHCNEALNELLARAVIHRRLRSELRHSEMYTAVTPGDLCGPRPRSGVHYARRHPHRTIATQLLQRPCGI